MATGFAILDTQTVTDVRNALTEGEQHIFDALCSKFHLNKYDRVLGWYRNGNYAVVIFPNGARFKFNTEDSMNPEFAESIDLNITNQCDGGCEFCYAGCTPAGKFADLRSMDDFLNSLHPYTELAIGLNDLTHPDLKNFLAELQKRRVIANGTINILHAIREKDRLVDWQKQGLIHGLGISFNGNVPNMESFDVPDFVQKFQNPVVHVIAGVISLEDLKALAYSNLNLLILGFKDSGRGASYRTLFQDVHKKEVDVAQYLRSLLSKRYFNAFQSICFDTIALEKFRNTIFCPPELDGKLDPDPSSINHEVPCGRLIPPEDFEQTYAGAEGEFTFYIDLVGKRYARNSVTRNRLEIPASMNVDEMFRHVRPH